MQGLRLLCCRDFTTWQIGEMFWLILDQHAAPVKMRQQL
jgi:hypothetical protein